MGAEACAAGTKFLGISSARRCLVRFQTRHSGNGGTHSGCLASVSNRLGFESILCVVALLSSGSCVSGGLLSCTCEARRMARTPACFPCTHELLDSLGRVSQRRGRDGAESVAAQAAATMYFG